MFFDMPLEKLETYCPERKEPENFDAFWASTLQEARQFPLDASFKPTDLSLYTVDTFDVTFNGYGGQPIQGWLLLPKQRQNLIPCVIEYIGYGGGRGFPIDWLLFSSAGYAHLIMDTRGQGSAWKKGDTPDPEGSCPHFPGFMTQGILSPETYYYRRVFTDAVRAIEAARAHPAIDAGKIAVSGGSQGGGITLATAGLDPSVAVAMPDVPFLCHYRRATSIVDSSPYSEITQYLKIHRDKVDVVFTTLDYFDGINFSARAQAQALFSTGLMDETCPPSTVFAAYNHFNGPKEIKTYAYNNHEGGDSHHAIEKIKFLYKIWPQTSR